MTNTATHNDYVETRFIFIGRAVSVKNTLGGKIISIDLLRKCETRDQAEQLASFFAWKERELPRAVGFVYSVEARFDGARIVGIRGKHRVDADQNKHGINAEWIAHWQAQERAEKVANRARKLETKYDRDELHKRLAPLKADYGATDKIGRLALEVVILDILRNG